MIKKDISRRHFLKSAGLLGAVATSSLHWQPVYSSLNALAGQSAGQIIEVFLEAKEAEVEFVPGVNTKIFTFNGSLPGPLIQANVGDTLVVHFTNNLPEPTTIHWHGVEVPAHMDGSSISQALIPAGGGTFRYEFKLLSAGTFWYHSHYNPNEQVEKGLYGALVVRDPEAESGLGLPDSESIFLLDDVLLDRKFQIDVPFPDDPLLRTEAQLNGREGDILLVNGSPLPAIDVQAGVPQRWRLLNVSNGRFMRVSLSGHTLYRIGGDGGLLEAPLSLSPIDQVQDADNPGALMSNPDPNVGLLLTPGERADVVFTPQGEPGDELMLEWHDFPRGRSTATYTVECNIVFDRALDDGRRAPAPLMHLNLVAGNPAASTYVLPSSLRTIPKIDVAGARPLPVRFEHTKADDEGNIVFSLTRDNLFLVPFEQVNDDFALEAKVGDTCIWELANLTTFDLPFHAHGFQFQLLETEIVDQGNPENSGVFPASFTENKDTIRIPARPGLKGSMTIVRLAVRFDDRGREGLVEAFGKAPSKDFSGGWICGSHILEQAAHGMLSYLNLRA